MTAVFVSSIRVGLKAGTELAMTAETRSPSRRFAPEALKNRSPK
jgi:hypothetical protein